MLVAPRLRVSFVSIALMALVALLFALASPAPAEAAQCKGGDAAPAKLSKKRAKRAVVCLLNKERRGRGMGSLNRQKHQSRAAGRHNRLMVKKNCFSHQCPGERDLTGRLMKANYLPCTCSWGIAENIVYSSGGSATPRRVVDMWMNSAGHRMNILNGSYEHVGIGVAWGTPSRGGGRNAMTVTTTFGYKK